MILRYHYVVTEQEDDCQEQGLDHSLHFSLVFATRNVLAPACTPFMPGCCQVGKVIPNQKVVLWDGQTCPNAMLGHPILSHWLPARMWLLMKLAHKPLFRRLIKLKLGLYFDWNFLIISKSETHDLSYRAKGKCLLVSVTTLSAPFASSLSFSPCDGSSKVMKELNKPWEELNIP